MSCPKNPKKFLFISYNGNHNWETYYISPMLTPNMYDMDTHCTLCGSRNRTFITHMQLVDMGYDPSKLNHLSCSRFGKSPKELR